MASSFRNQDFGTVQKIVQQWLKHPIVWSGLASIGVHGVLFTLLPFLSATALNENPPDIQRSVDLVELTPEEQQRLPDFPDEVPVDLPPLTQNPAQNPPDLFSTLPPLPGGAIPNQTIPPLDSPFFNPLPIPSFPIFPTLPPAPRFPLSNPPAPVTPPRPEATRPTPSATPSTQAERPQQPANPTTETENQPAQTAQNPENPPATPQRSPSEQLIARNQELRQLYAYNPEGTSNEAFRETGTSWLLAAREKLGDAWTEEVEQNLDPDNVVNLEGSYPKAACPRRPNDVMMGVLVDGDGKIVQEALPPAILQSSGYGIFNQLALEAVNAHEFEAKGKTLPYYVRVTFNPSAACPAGSTPQQPTQPQEAPPS